jgi:hypothetical protein
LLKNILVYLLQEDENALLLHPRFKRFRRYGDVAQLVEQRTENPCVGGSIPSITTLKNQGVTIENRGSLFCWYNNDTTFVL